MAELPDDFADLPPALREELLGCAPADRARIAAAYRAHLTHVTDQSQASTVDYQARAAAAAAAEQAAQEEHARRQADLNAQQAAVWQRWHEEDERWARVQDALRPFVDPDQVPPEKPSP
jgi:hypothetical protein